MKRPSTKGVVPGCQEREAAAINSGFERLYALRETDTRVIDAIVQADGQAHREYEKHPEERRRQFDEDVLRIETSRNAIGHHATARQAWQKAGEHHARIYDSPRLNFRWSLFGGLILVAFIALFQMSWRECLIAASATAAVCIGGRGMWSMASTVYYTVVAAAHLTWDYLRLAVGYPVLRWKAWRRSVWSLREQKLNRTIDAREQILRRHYQTCEAVALQAAQGK